jgi:hypothetical protein
MEELKTQFVYKREIKVPPVQEDAEKGIVGSDGYTKIVEDSFDIERVIRTITIDDGKLLVLLDDLHERFEDRPMVHPKTKAPKFTKKGEMMFERVKDTFQSEIYLSKEEAEQYRKLTTINL